ncbi:MAG: hypothetical protein NVS1B11_04230 [Terriglobales bacterium]
MKICASFVLLSALAIAQTDNTRFPNTSSPSSPQLRPPRQQDVQDSSDLSENDAKSHQLIIPSGTRVPVALKEAISTKNTHQGDAVYAQTTFPVAINDQIVIPAGTYVQGRIVRIQRGGRIKGRAEVLMHFTTLIYPNGYTVMLPGSIENAPGADKSTVKDQEGTIQQDSQTGQKVGTAAGTAGTGAIIGGVSHGLQGGLIGAGAGGAVGTAIAMLTRGSDVKLPEGTTLEMLIQRDVPLDSRRISRVRRPY